MTICILGSRTYQPLSDIDARIMELPPGTTVLAFGSAPVCTCALSAATARGLPARNVALSGSRSELLAEAANGATVWLFVATDPATRRPTTGIGGVMTLLDAQGVAYRRFDAPLPGRVCEALSRVHEAVERVRAAKQEGRRRAAFTRALAAAQGLVALRDEFARRLEDGLWIGSGDAELDDRWLGWERTYRACCDGLTEVGLLMDGRAV